MNGLHDTPQRPEGSTLGVRPDHKEGSTLGVRPPRDEGFRLIETMRWEAGATRCLERHAARLARSARRFGFSFSKKAFRAEVRRATHALPAAPHRLRLTLGPGGDFESEAAPLDEDCAQRVPLRLVLAEERAGSADPFFRHKTTWRRVYENAYRAARENGFDDALLLNERGEVTEATRANIFVEKDERFYTPPARCGLLPGVGRGVWLEEEERAATRVLHPPDLYAADALYLVSALRGRRRAVLKGESKEAAR